MQAVERKNRLPVAQNRKEYMRQWMSRNNLKSYGMTELDYEDMLKDQDFKCAICKKHISEFKRSLSIDHNHETDQVRGLLCPRCNYYLVGNKTLDELNKVVEYLSKSNQL